MAAANRTWGGERIRGELLKLHIRVAKSTIQRYLRSAHPPRRSGQTWATFLSNHGKHIWAADFLPITDLLFRPLHAFFLIELASRRVVHVGVTRHPTDAWVAQQLRQATPFDRHPKYLLRDNDSRYGPAFARMAKSTGIEELRTAYRAPKENAVCERSLASVRRECLDHLLVLGEAHLRRILFEYMAYFNRDRPHQWLRQRIPNLPEEDVYPSGPVYATPVLGGLAPHLPSRSLKTIRCTYRPGQAPGSPVRVAVPGVNTGSLTAPSMHLTAPGAPRRLPVDRPGCAGASGTRDPQGARRTVPAS